MDFQIAHIDEPPGECDLLEHDHSPIASRKRQRQNLQDVSNTKLLVPSRASGRIRIKMAAAAAEEAVLKSPVTTSIQKPSLTSKITKVKQRQRQKKTKSDVLNDLIIDMKRPSSVLVDTSIRALLTNMAFAQLSPENQKILIECLPLVDRPSASFKENQIIELNNGAINNEFFNRACIEWRDRLAYGEFTNEHQTKLRVELERDRAKIDPWKARNFEGIWGLKIGPTREVNVGAIMEKSAMEMKSRMEQGDFEIPEGFISEVWQDKANDAKDEDDEKLSSDDITETNGWEMTPSPQESLSASASTPSETVTSTQPDQPELSIEIIKSPFRENSLSPDACTTGQPIIAEATSSADIQHLDNNSPTPANSEFIPDDDDQYVNDIASHVELSNDEVSSWYHQQEHDYLKNVTADEIDERPPLNLMEPESSGMNDDSNRIENYDVQLPQDIFHKADLPASMSTPNMTINNTHQATRREEPIMVAEQHSNRFNRIAMQEEPIEYYQDRYMVEEEPDRNSGYCVAEEIRVNVPKNVKLLAFPSGVNYNIIEEHQPRHIQQQPQTYRTNGNIQSVQGQYFVGSNFAYISKMGNKLDTEPTRIAKQETSNNQGQVKQRIIYGIATEPKITYEQPSTHHVYTTPAQPEIYHQMVKHSNGTTTIYTETSTPSKKKTIIQRKKVDPYTVQMALQGVANNNTIILTPINTQQQSVVPQQQKSIVQIHRTAPMMQTSASSVQFIQPTFVKKQTVIIPQMAPSTAIKSQPKYTTVIRSPAITTIQQQPAPVSTKIQKPIQKQKVIMSTSSLQQYRSYNQKPSPHGSRKQLHPQQIIRPTPATTVIHHQMTPEPKGNQIPVILSTGNIQNQQVNAAAPTIVTIGGPANSNFLKQRGQTIKQEWYPKPASQPQQVYQQQIPQQQITHQQIQQNSQPVQSHQIQNHQIQQQPQASSGMMIMGPGPRARHHPNNQRPPSGNVNYERSYQICQAVIQNSPNRHQLNCQLKSPTVTPSIMGQPPGGKKF